MVRQGWQRLSPVADRRGLGSGSATSTAAHATTSGTASTGDGDSRPQAILLYAWQQQALVAWKSEGHRGVVEAVTGTGKTRVGIVAIRDSLAAGGFVHVLVPSIDLQDQWCRN